MPRRREIILYPRDRRAVSGERSCVRNSDHRIAASGTPSAANDVASAPTDDRVARNRSPSARSGRSSGPHRDSAARSEHSSGPTGRSSDVFHARAAPTDRRVVTRDGRAASNGHPSRASEHCADATAGPVAARHTPSSQFRHSARRNGVSAARDDGRLHRIFLSAANPGVGWHEICRERPDT
jgi:hypothetical protein